MSELKWKVLLVTTASTSLVFLDNTIMPVAIPTIQKELHFSEISGLWIVNAYLLTLMSLLLIAGKLVDRFGKRTLYYVGFGLFGIGSLYGALSTSTFSLILARVVQGVGGSAIIPTTGALLMETFPVKQRAKALGINTGISSLFLIIGPFLGGFFTNYLSWRYIFYVNLPIIIFGILMARQFITSSEKKRLSFNFFEAFLLIASVISLVVALMEGGRIGWTKPLILFLLSLFVLLFSLYIVFARKSRDPTVPFNLFKNHLFKWATVCIFASQLSVVLTIEWAIYFQEGLQYTPFHTGMLILVATSPVFLMAPFGGYLAEKFTAFVPITTGFLLLIFSFIWIYFFSKGALAFYLFPGLLAFGCGIPLIFSPAFATAMTEVDGQKLGRASSMITMTRQLAATIGIALITAVFESVFQHTGSYYSAFAATLFLGITFASLGLLVALLTLKRS